MRPKGLCVILLIPLLLGACGDDTTSSKVGQTKEDQTKQAAPMDAIGPLLPERVPLAPEEREKASQILAFNNFAQEAFNRGYYSLPLKLVGGVRHYVRVYELPKIPKRPAKPVLKPTDGIFDMDEEKQLAKSLLEMDNALDKMFSSYRDLHAYVHNDDIRDDGKLGRKLAQDVESTHKQFMAAKKTWLEIVEKRAQEAENALLQTEPLSRQIIIAGKLKSLREEAQALVATGEPDRQNLASIARIMNENIVEGGKPPFPAAPAIEKLYRDYLKNCDIYAKLLKRTADEGVFAHQKRELGQAGMDCSHAWNEFARAVNARPLPRP